MFNQKIKIMTQTERDMQLVESQPLTVKNAHRVAMIRKKESTEPPVPFHFRKKHLGMESFVHFSGKPEDEKELRPADFKDWEVTEFKYPGYLEDQWEAACNAYRWNSFDPDIRGESDIMIYEKEIHDDLKRIPAERHEEYITAYKQKFAAQLSALARCASPMVTGRSGFNVYKHEKANRTYQNRYEELRRWRDRILKTMERTKEEKLPEEEKQEKA